MRRVLLALVIGVVFVGVVWALGREQVWTPLPFWLLLPGIFAGATVPGSHFNLKSDQPWGLVSRVVFYAVNTAVYGAAAYFMLYVSSLKLKRTTDQSRSEY